MAETTLTWQRISDRVYVAGGAIHMGVLVQANRAILIDCCDSLTWQWLTEKGIHAVDMILCTQHRRTHTAGLAQFAGSMVPVLAAEQDRMLFEEADNYWQRPENRWHIYHQQPGPLVLQHSVRITRTLREGETIEWAGLAISVLETPGATDGSLSFLVSDGDDRICFCGDALYAGGRLHDLYSLQKGLTTTDYHGFIGNARQLLPSLRKLHNCAAGWMVPSHGPVIDQAAPALAILADRLDRLYENYESISSLNFYFPDFFQKMGLSRAHEKLEPAATFEPPDFLRPIGQTTSFILVSQTGAALTIDCGSRQVTDQLRGWISQGLIRSVDACWVTHYHDDHVDGLHSIQAAFDCPVMTTASVADIIRQPERYFLPCISPVDVPSVQVKADGETWSWEEFTLTSFELPGQTLYHSGLLIQSGDARVLMAGDSFSPTGLDDYCCGNRNFLGEGRGYRRCLDLLRRYQPTAIINEHQEKAFCFSASQIDYMERRLIEREEIIRSLSPWSHPDFMTDEWWVHAWPYEQAVPAGGLAEIEVHLTNHGSQPAEAAAAPVLPAEWDASASPAWQYCLVPPNTGGLADAGQLRPDGIIRLSIRIPANAAYGRILIPLRIRWDGRYLGQYRHAFLKVTAT